MDLSAFAAAAANSGAAPSSASARFPSPFAETRVAAVADLQRRTFSSAPTFASLSDRIGRN
jgi:hypothetical protein